MATRTKVRAPAARNPVARELAAAKYRKRVVAAGRGKGSYSRKNSRPDASRDGCRFSGPARSSARL
jgi:stalled ribosome alternative rescue factor ArfA